VTVPTVHTCTHALVTQCEHWQGATLTSSIMAPCRSDEMLCKFWKSVNDLISASLNWPEETMPTTKARYTSDLP